MFRQTGSVKTQIYIFDSRLAETLHNTLRAQQRRPENVFVRKPLRIKPRPADPEKMQPYVFSKL